MGKKQKEEAKAMKDRLENLRRQIKDNIVKEREITSVYDDEKRRNIDVTSKIDNLKKTIEQQNEKIEKHEEGEQNNDDIADSVGSDQKVGKQGKKEKFKTKLQIEKEQQNALAQNNVMNKKLQLNISEMIDNQIQIVCKKVMGKHFERLNEFTMEYIVIHSNKKAIFKLKSMNDTFGSIKGNIAEYFGLPKDGVYLKNQKGEILLSNNRVVQELFPLETSKIIGFVPKIYVTFQKNLSTTDYILGDPLVQKAKENENAEKDRNIKMQEERDLKAKDKMEKDASMELNRQKAFKSYQQEKNFRSSIQTINFLAFTFMHVSLSYSQYNVGQMYAFNKSVTLGTMPFIDVTRPVGVKQFLSRPELENYFLQDMNKLFRDASKTVQKKNQFYSFNHILPVIKFTQIRADEIPCGSIVSNNKGLNKAAEDNAPLNGTAFTAKYGYPIQGEKCYSTFVGGKFATSLINDTMQKNGTLPFKKSDRLLNSCTGFINAYSGNGYQKTVQLNISNVDFFQEMFQKEIVDQNWTRDPAVLSFVMQFYVYNINQEMLDEKRLVIEFLEQGGFINLEHDSLLMNTKLYRDLSQNIQSISVLFQGACLVCLSIWDIKADNSDADGDDDEDDEEGGPPPDEEEGADGEEAVEEVDKTTLKYILINCPASQKVNFFAIFLTYVNQFAKNGYDAYGASLLKSMLVTEEDMGKNPMEYVDMTYLFIFNQVVMFVDSFLICLAALSLLKYTSLANQNIEIIANTVENFIKGTVRKTMLLIFLTYILFGQMCNYILCYYQYGFFLQLYALLRACMVFMNGFIINEQTIFLSKETVENLKRYNGFGITFGLLISINIIIRQVMVNIFSIYMHADYHEATIRTRMEQQMKRDKLKAKIEKATVLLYKNEQLDKVM